MFGMGQGFLWIILFNNIKLVMNTTVPFLVVIMNHVAAIYNPVSYILRTEMPTNLDTSVFNVEM